MRLIRPEWFVFTLIALAVVSSISMVFSADPNCTPTRPDAEGPFYVPNAPKRVNTGQGLVVAGTVRSASGCGSVAGAQIEWWSANPKGRYDDEHRATQQVDAQGRYRYETDFPGGYSGRPPHLHVRVTAPGHRPLVTQLYPKPEQKTISFDFVLAKQEKIK